VGVPGVYIQEEILFVVALQPVHCPGYRLWCVPVRLKTPPGADVSGLVASLLLVPGRRAFLALDGEEGLKTPVIVHPIPQIERSIHAGGSTESLPGQELGQGLDLARQRLPFHKRDGPAAREQVGSRRHGWESCGVVPVEPDRPGCQEVKRRGVYRLVAVRANVVTPQGISHYPDDVHYLDNPPVKALHFSGPAFRP
jgi:hypothetical protein